VRNTLILTGQIHHNEQEGLAPFDAVVEATVQRARPVVLTAMYAIWFKIRPVEQKSAEEKIPAQQ
jgi:multidrug efflux pump subunit AcrB